MIRRSWTARTLANALDAPVGVVTRTLHDEVAAGRAVRLTANGQSFYVDGSLRDLLERLEAKPADADDADALRHHLRSVPGTRAHRIATVQDRARRLLKGDPQ